jgi:hypothetical protein
LDTGIENMEFLLKREREGISDPEISSVIDLDGVTVLKVK